MGLSVFKNIFPFFPPAFGLDISDSGIKYAQLEPYKNNLRLKLHGEKELEKGVVEEGVIKNPEELAKALHSIKTTNKKRDISNHVIISLPDEETFLKVINLPKLESKELGNAVFVEAEGNIPIDVNKAYMEYGVLDFSSEGEQMDVLIAAARKKTVEAYSDVVREGGFVPVVLEPEVMAIARSAIPQNKDQKTNIIVEVGASRTRLIVFVKNTVVLTGVSSFSSNSAAEAITKELGVDLPTAHDLRWDVGLGEHEEYGYAVKEALAFPINGLLDDIISYVSYIKGRGFSGNSDYDVERIILSGGGSQIPGLTKQLSISLKLPVESVNPWVNILPSNISETPELSREHSVRYTTSLGLALRGIESKNTYNVF